MAIDSPTSCADLGFVDFENVDEHVAIGSALDALFQPLDLDALATDDDSRTGGVDIDLELVRRALDVDRRDSGMPQTLLERLAQRQILVEQLGIFLLGIPA